MSEWFVPAVVGLFGTATGSFVNVLVYRIPSGRSLWTRSTCPACGHPIMFADITPVLSWFWLRGRCRSCRHSISARYPAIEFLTGLTWLFIARLIGIRWTLPGALWTATALIAGALILADGSRPPARFITVALGGSGLLLAMAALLGYV